MGIVILYQLQFKCSHETASPHSSRVQAELLGILAAIITIYRTEQEVNCNTSATIILISSHKGALHTTLQDSPLGLKTATSDHHDIILEIRHLCHLLQTKLFLITILPSYHDSNNTSSSLDQTNSLYREFISQPTLESHQGLLDYLPSSHVITALHKGTAIHHNLPKVIKHTLYGRPLQAKLMKDNKWSDQQLYHVDWDSYNQALRSTVEQKLTKP